jgi:GDP-L-fucose synthase
VIIDAAAKVGGILANNDYPYQFIMENMQIQNNLIDTALQSGVEVYFFWKFLHLSISATTAKEEYCGYFGTD